jgi:IMP dehydrogenase
LAPAFACWVLVRLAYYTYTSSTSEARSKKYIRRIRAAIASHIIQIKLVEEQQHLASMTLEGGDGVSSAELFGRKRKSCQAYTYDDIIIMPGHVSNSEQEVSLENHVTKKICLKVPLLSSPMDTVTEHDMAIGMALQGALGIIHYNMTVEEQANEVRLVKKFKNGFILDPTCLSPEHLIADVDKLKEELGYSGFPITIDGKMGSKLVGILTNRDIDYIEDRTIQLRDVMTTDVYTGTFSF